MPVPGWIDRDHREEASFPATIELADGRRFQVTITNVSIAGCQLQTRETLPIGASVQLCVSGQKLPADVRWALPGSAGLRFDEA